MVEDGLLGIHIFLLVVRMRVSGCAFFWNRTMELFWWRWIVTWVMCGVPVRLNMVKSVVDSEDPPFSVLCQTLQRNK